MTGLDIAHAYGVELRLERERRGWTQAHLAEQIGIARPNLARSEAGHHTPRLEQFVRSAEVFEMEPAHLGRSPVRARARGGTVKALTLIQPWAFAVEHLGKPVENRTWAPPKAAIGKRFAIHAGKQVDRKVLNDFRSSGELARVAASRSPYVELIPRGAITCSALLRGWVRGTQDRVASSREVLEVVGDVTPERALEIVRAPRWWAGPIGWVLADVLPLFSPISCSGSLGLWTVPVDIAEVVKEGTYRPPSANRLEHW